MPVLFQDESHYLKNIKTARCRAAMPLLKVRMLHAKPPAAKSRLPKQSYSLSQQLNSSVVPVEVQVTVAL